MSRNLAESSCCKNIVRLSDIRGKPIEFRRYGKYHPQIGTRWDCPNCKTAYFAIWRSYETFHGVPDEPGKFVIDLSYYESYDDEHWYADDGKPDMSEKPGHLCEDNAEDCQWIW